MPHPAQNLLDFIGRFEARGDYNMVFGGQIVPNLTSMNIDDVMALMARMLDDQRRRRGRAISTAVGKYQIIRNTLQMLVGRMRLDPTMTVFTPEMQDRMAMELLRIRGYERFVAGQLSDVDFAINVAKEWASMPLPNGKSFYAQDGINKSLVGYDDFIRTVRLARPSSDATCG